jgi:hypothetical protein
VQLCDTQRSATAGAKTVEQTNTDDDGALPSAFTSGDVLSVVDIVNRLSSENGNSDSECIDSAVYSPV